MEEFYKDLYLWVVNVNKLPTDLPHKKYWDKVFDSSKQLMDKYNNNLLVVRIVDAHVVTY